MNKITEKTAFTLLLMSINKIDLQIYNFREKVENVYTISKTESKIQEKQHQQNLRAHTHKIK